MTGSISAVREPKGPTIPDLHSEISLQKKGSECLSQPQPLRSCRPFPARRYRQNHLPPRRLQRSSRTLKETEQPRSLPGDSRRESKRPSRPPRQNKPRHLQPKSAQRKNRPRFGRSPSLYPATEVRSGPVHDTKPDVQYRLAHQRSFCHQPTIWLGLHLCALLIYSVSNFTARSFRIADRQTGWELPNNSSPKIKLSPTSRE